MGECFFLYWLTQVVPDKIQRAVKWSCVCVQLSLFHFTVQQTQSDNVCHVEHKHTHTHTHTCAQPFYDFPDSVRDNPGGRYQKKHSPTLTYRGQSSIICFLDYDPWHPPCSMPGSLFPLSLQVFFLTGQSHFHATYYFTHNCCTISVSVEMIYPYW